MTAHDIQQDQPRPTSRFFAMTLPIWLLVSTVLVTIGLTYSGWQRVRNRVVLADEYRFSHSSVQVTQLPPWVPKSIVNDVISEFNIGRTQRNAMIDHELLEELAAAFQAYPWVESVDRVHASYPATVTLDLTYRRPICLVLLPKDAGGYAVDRHGVHLPSDYFKNHGANAAQYIKVIGVESMPAGNIGEEWGDIVVEKAAALAAHLAPDNSILRIASIEAEQVGPNRRAMRQIFHLTTSQGTKIIWGEMPLAENDSRKEQLLELVREYSSLDKAPLDDNDTIDLRPAVL